METLRYGSTGTEVMLLQLALGRSGSPAGNIDGVFGTRTLNALRRFQSRNGLTPDGIAGPATWEALMPYLVGYTRITVKPGDTFFRLGRRFGVTASDIAAANPTVDPTNIQVGSELVIPLGFPLVPTDIPYTSKLVELILTGLSVRYPFTVTHTMGESVLGRPISLMGAGRGERQLFVNAAHHANEWITTPLVLKFLEDYLSAYVNGGTILGRNAADLFDAVTLYVAPLVNPDGVDLVNGAIDLESPAYENAVRIAGNYPSIPFPSGWKANIEGTDLNLNYPAKWEEARRIKFEQGFVSPAPRDYVGTAPLSAKESLAVYSHTLEHDFIMSISYHTQGKVIFWKFEDIEPPEGKRIGEAMADASGYRLTDVPYESSFAGYKDWFILNYGRPAYTVEAGVGVNPLPLSQFDTIYRDNSALIATFMIEASKL